MTVDHRVPQFYTSILYLIGFILFLEWLYPTTEIGDVSYLHIFIIYTIFCMIITILSLKWWVSILLKGTGLLIAINVIYYSEPFLSKVWLQNMYYEIVMNFQFLFAQDWYSFTSLFRTSLFLLIIWLMSYLIHYWFVVTRKFLLFIILTITYLAIIDTFTTYDATFAIVRTFIFSFVALGLGNYFKEMYSSSLNTHRFKKSLAWVIPLLMVVCFSAVIGYAAPKFDPKWPDPVPFLESMSDHIGFFNGNKGGSRKTGYGDNDTQLGGSFKFDENPVFEAITTEANYWRVDTKDVYTGKGWVRSEDNIVKRTSRGNIFLDLFDQFDDNNDIMIESNSALISFKEDSHIGKLTYPYAFQHLHIATEDEIDLEYDSFGAVIPYKDDERLDLDVYGLSYLSPIFQVEALQKAQNVEINEEATIDYGKYTQVPETLPSRVTELAQEITAPYETNYDKARAIEGYFGRSGFTYEVEDVPFPDEEDDYVDQFLFETKRGYCDNYSTSMVVMLRTLGIPARWVKGFTAGDVIEEGIDISGVADELGVLVRDDKQYNKYEVSNSNAHSWVEVYFSGIGWVPFEPTQGFSNLVEFESSIEEPTEEESEPASTTEDHFDIEPPEPEIPDIEIDQEVATGKEEKNNIFLQWLLILGFVIISILAIAIYKYRIQIKIWFIKKRLERKPNVETYQKAYLYLLKLLKREGLKRNPDQTLRQYAEQVDQRFRTEEMAHLTNFYEQIIYNNQSNLQTHEISDLWESLIKRVMA